MLKLKYLFENFDLARECLGHYDADTRVLDRTLPYFRISSNAVYPFRTLSKKTCVLRISPAAERAEEDFKATVRLISWLNERAFPAMRVYPMRDGRPSDVLDTKWGRYNVACFEQLGGETLEDCDGSPELVRGYGRTLAQLHRALGEYPHADDFRDHLGLLQTIRERFERYKAPATLLNEWEALSRELALLPKDADCYGLIHYDFEADNVMFDEESGEFAVIDFDDAVRCWYALDIARALDCLDDVAEDADEKDFLDGYREILPLPPELAVSLPLMRRLVSLQEYAELLHVLSEPLETEPDWMTELVGKLRKRLAGIEAGLN